MQFSLSSRRLVGSQVICQVISTHRAYLTKHIATRASDIRYLSSGQVVFLLAMHDMETMRSAQGLTSSLVTYFVNDSLNRNAGLTACMEAIAEKVGLFFLCYPPILAH